MGGWVRHEPAAERSPDERLGQIGDVWQARWSRPLADDLHAVVTRVFFPMEFTDDDGVPNGDRNLYQINDFIACTDPSNPVETELWSDDRHTGVIDGEPTSPAAHDSAMAAEPPTDEEWNRAAPDDWSLDADARGRAAERASAYWAAKARHEERRQRHDDDADGWDC